MSSVSWSTAGPSPADLVVDASGRAPRLGGPVVEEIGGECGLAYVDRRYRLRQGAEPGPLTQPYVWGGSFDGFDAMVFPHERGHFSVVIVRPTSDHALKQLRHRELFESACRAVPGLDEWTDPDRSVPCGDVLPGGLLRNVYRWQRPLRGVVSVGDAVATTTPTAGRGVAMASMQIGLLLGLIDGGADLVDVGAPFGALVRRRDPPVGGGSHGDRHRARPALARRRARPGPPADVPVHPRRRRPPTRGSSSTPAATWP